jgi:hypothetical protein
MAVREIDIAEHWDAALPLMAANWRETGCGFEFRALARVLHHAAKRRADVRAGRLHRRRAGGLRRRHAHRPHPFNPGVKVASGNPLYVTPQYRGGAPGRPADAALAEEMRTRARRALRLLAHAHRHARGRHAGCARLRVRRQRLDEGAVTWAWTMNPGMLGGMLLGRRWPAARRAAMPAAGIPRPRRSPPCGPTPMDMLQRHRGQSRGPGQHVPHRPARRRPEDREDHQAIAVRKLMADDTLQGNKDPRTLKQRCLTRWGSSRPSARAGGALAGHHHVPAAAAGPLLRAGPQQGLEAQQRDLRQHGHARAVHAGRGPDGRAHVARAPVVSPGHARPR